MAAHAGSAAPSPISRILMAALAPTAASGDDDAWEARVLGVPQAFSTASCVRGSNCALRRG